MPRFPGVSHVRAVKAFKKAGFRISREGKHIVMTDGERIITIPRADPINSYTMAGIIARPAPLGLLRTREMGLVSVVGIMASFAEAEDEEGAAYFRGQFEKINRLLRAAGIPAHEEPEKLKVGRPLELEMFGYSGIHYLRRVAAYLWDGKDLPPPGSGNSLRDSIVARYYQNAAEIENAQKTWSKRIRASKKPDLKFEHLMCHSDGEGFYIPVDFEHVVIDSRGFGISEIGKFLT